MYQISSTAQQELAKVMAQPENSGKVFRIRFLGFG
jgi:hypothetical protein